MDEKKLMIFLQKLLENGTPSKSSATLHQLKTILEEQDVSPDLIELVDTTIKSLPEAREIALNQMITKENIEIAKQRADARIMREREMFHYRGCR